MERILYLVFLIYSTTFSFAQSNYSSDWTGTNISNISSSTIATYTLIGHNPNSAGTGCSLSCLPAGSPVSITFPGGTNLTTFSGGEFYGEPINGATISGTSLTFLSPVEVPKNTSFKVILKDITNPPAGNYSNLEMAVNNFSKGINQFIKSNYSIINSNNISNNGLNTSCTGILFDTGGGEGDYANNQNLTYSINVASATSISLHFIQFKLLTGDQFFVYDGPTANSPQVPGSPFSGLSTPVNITSSSGSLTIRFSSDATGVSEGFKINWTCNSNASAPSSDFFADPSSSCEGQGTNFIDLSTNKPNAWEWSFPGAIPSSSNSQYPSNIVYPKPGLYAVTLKAINSFGNSIKTINSYVNISSGPCKVIVGKGATTNNMSSYPAPYGNYYQGARHQFLILANELLKSRGGPGEITSMAFNVSASQGSPLKGFKIRLTNTKRIQLNKKLIDTTFLEVLEPKTYTESLGWNVHVFENSFYWNGVDNLLVEICFNNNSKSFNAQTFFSATNFNSSSYYRGNIQGVCDSSNAGFISTNRPNMRFEFNFCTSSPKPDFTVDKTASCSNDSIQFLDQSNCDPIEWVWEIPGGIPSFSNLANPKIYFPNPGIFDVKLKVKNSFGEDSIIKNKLITIGVPNAEFSSSKKIINSGEDVDFYDLSTCNPSSWSWSFPGGNPSSSTIKNPMGITYSCGGTYPVILTTKNENGEFTRIKNAYITINGDPFCNSFQKTKKGLNYVQTTEILHRRGGTMGDCNYIFAPQPRKITVSGIPPGAIVESAFMWWTLSGSLNSTSVTLSNPLGNIRTIPATLLGIGPDKCWNLNGTRSFRADVKEMITGNGEYSISGLPYSGIPGQSSNDTDGATLIVVYSNASANYSGSLTLMDGLHVGTTGTMNFKQIMKTFPTCENPNNSRAFMMLGDLQLPSGSADSANQLKLPNSNFKTYLPYCLWGNYGGLITFNPLQDTFSFAIKRVMNNGSDCYGLACMGVYFQCPDSYCNAPGKPNRINGPDSVCSNNENIVFSTPGVNGADSYFWELPVGWNILSGQGTNVISVKSGSTGGTVYVKAINACDSSLPNYKLIYGWPGPKTFAGKDTSIACGNTVTLQGSASSGTGTLTIQWLNGPTTYDYPNVGPGIYIFMATDSLGCSNFDTIIVKNANSKLDFLFEKSKDTICLGDSIVLMVNVIEPMGNVNFYWSDPNIPQNAGPHVFFPKSDSIITLKIIDEQTCSVEHGFKMFVNPIPYSNAGKDQKICHNTEIQIGDNPIQGYEYSWTPVEGLSNSKISNPIFKSENNSDTLQNIQLVLNATFNGCFKKDSITVLLFPNPKLSFDSINPVCIDNGFVVLNAAKPIGGMYSGFGISNNQFDPKQAGIGTHKITYTFIDSNTCKDSIFGSIEVLPTPKAFYNFSRTKLEVKFYGSTLTGVNNWYWDFGDRSDSSTEMNPIHTYNQIGKYLVTLIAKNICGSDTIIFEIEVDNNNGGGGNTFAQQKIDEITNFSIFPNPFQENLTLTFLLKSPSPIALSIFDIMGRLLLIKNIEEPLSPGEHSIKLDTAPLVLKNGFYILQIISKYDTNKKLIIKN